MLIKFLRPFAFCLFWKTEEKKEEYAIFGDEMGEDSQKWSDFFTL